MIIDTTIDKVYFFDQLYSDALARSSVIEEKLKKHLKQYKGTTEIDGSHQEASMIRNITYELIESQVSTATPLPNVFPQVFSEKASMCAKTAETFLRNKRHELPFKRLNDLDERLTTIYGGSVWLVEWDDSIKTNNTIGGVKLSCLAPTKFVGQPYVYNIEDMEYCFVDIETTKEDVRRKYGVSLSVAEETESENATDECATVHICYYKDEEEHICQYIWSGDVELSDVTDYYARKRRSCNLCGKREGLCECERPVFELQNEEFEEITEDIPLSDGTVLPAMSRVIENGVPKVETRQVQALDQLGNPMVKDIGGVLMPYMMNYEEPVMESTRLPFYKPKRFPIVIRKNTSEEDSLLGQSDCEFIRPQQQAINKVESRIMEKLMRSAVTPVMPEDASIALGNSIFGQVIKMKPSENKGMYGTIDTTPDISKDIAEAERLYDHAKRILGISSSYQGQYDSSAQSGKAKQMQIMQASGRLDSKRQMKCAAYSEIDRIMFELYLAYADEPRAAVYKDAWGRWQNRTFNRYDFIERAEDGKYFYNDEFLFLAENTAETEKEREYLWEENRKNFQMGAYGDPAQLQSQLIFWQNMESAHYPWASDNVERVKESITAQMEALQAEMQKMQADADEERQSREEYEKFLRERK